MLLTELPTLMRELEGANLERALRLLNKFFNGQGAGAYALKPDGSPLLHTRTAVGDADKPSTALLVDRLLHGIPHEMMTLESPGLRAVIVSPRQDARMLMWLDRVAGWSEEHTTAFQCAAMYIARLAELQELFADTPDTVRLDQRLADASHFAGRIAHDFDNIFTGVMGFTDLSITMLAADSPVQEFLKEVHDAGTRGLAFTQQLHDLSRSGVLRFMPTPPALVLQKEKQRLAKERRVQWPSDAKLPDVALEANCLQQVLAALIDNALQSSREGAVIVGVQCVELNKEDAPGPHVEFAIRDNGPGVRDDILPRLFHEPFVSTKVRHRGLGLPICYRVLRVHRAGIRLDSLSGRGTTARVVVPLATARTRNSAAVTRDVAHSTGS
jgi:signal transduction histidine kinase